MSLYFTHAGQAEILRSTQKDLSYTNEIKESLLQLINLPQHNVQIVNSIKILAELLYHGFAIANNIQTLGEEYTGIIQIDKNYTTLPHKIVQFVSIVLEFGGETMLLTLLKKYQRNIEDDPDILPEYKEMWIVYLDNMKSIIPYIKAVHRIIFYIRGRKFQISKRLTGINYVLVRHWLKENHSVYGYKILGVLTALQLLLSSIIYINNKTIKKSSSVTTISPVVRSSFSKSVEPEDPDAKKCILCLDICKNITATQCGHTFCWLCINNWLQMKTSCPVCRESIKKSTICCLRNY